jgi:hypothetical protein
MSSWPAAHIPETVSPRGTKRKRALQDTDVSDTSDTDEYVSDDTDGQVSEKWGELVVGKKADTRDTDRFRPRLRKEKSDTDEHDSDGTDGQVGDNGGELAVGKRADTRDTDEPRPRLRKKCIPSYLVRKVAGGMPEPVFEVCRRWTGVPGIFPGFRVLLTPRVPSVAFPVYFDTVIQAPAR